MISNILFGAIVVSDSLNSNQAKQDDNFFKIQKKKNFLYSLKGKRWWLKWLSVGPLILKPWVQFLLGRSWPFFFLLQENFALFIGGLNFNFGISNLPMISANLLTYRAQKYRFLHVKLLELELNCLTFNTLRGFEALK